MPNSIKTILEKHKENIKNYDKIKQHLDNEEKRVENLSLFEKCSSIADFPSSDEVFHINPIGLVGVFGSSGCYCNRDFTVDEVKEIVKVLRDSENINNIDLFTASNCNIPNADKTYGRLTEELNKTMKKYHINSCLRKAHFLAQCYHETDRLKTTLEYGDGKKYNPGKHPDAIKNGNTQVGDGRPRYRGRGFMQLTWKKNYKAYEDATGVTCISNSSLISDNLVNAINSGGWYWENGSAWNDLNPRADKDDIYYINIGVNGGSNGFQERINYIKKIIEILNLKQCPNIFLTKELGKYNLTNSAMKNTRYVKNNPSIKMRLEGFDD
jgi:predicted chitinase